MSDRESGGNAKVTREDWLNLARDVLISEGVEQVKVLNLGARLGVSRSSFYWYFDSRKALLDTLLKHWERTNTQVIVDQCALPAETITGAVCNLFRCFLDTRQFNPQLDFAVRDLRAKGVATPHDETVAAVLAEVLAGGPEADMTEPVAEKAILALERAAFMKLVRTEPTLARMEHTLDTGKPLRN